MDHGADVNAASKKLLTPLHLAAYGETDEYYAVAEQLLNAGANIKAVDSDNDTPLDIARNPKSKFLNN